MTVPVLWLPLGPGGPPSRGAQWDLALIDALLTGEAWRPAGGEGFTHSLLAHDPLLRAGVDSGVVAVVPGRYWAGHEEKLERWLGRFEWCVALVTSDEESTLDPGWAPRRGYRWTMTPRPGVHTGSRFLGEGWRPETPVLLPEVGDGARFGWWFCGQANHPRRQRMLEELRGSGLGGVAVVTDGFAADAGRGGGMDARQYLTGLTAAKVAPAPAGPATPDSFRLYEALEAGCVPVTDADSGSWPDESGRLSGSYWLNLFGQVPPWPVVGWGSRSWPEAVDYALDGWARKAARCSSWWQLYKRTLAYRFADDVREAGGLARRTGTLEDLVTVVVTASPIPSDPHLGVLTATVESIREQLPHAEMVVAFDGARVASADYDEAVRRATWKCEHEWDQAVPVLAHDWVHQSGAVEMALREVRTPLVLMVEHDTPMCGDVPWLSIAGALLDGQVDVVRFHHEAHILEPHRYLMVDERPVDLGFPALRTVQWSQRPHLARTGYYREIIDRYFRRRSGFIEDTMHSVVQTAWNDHGFAGWRQHKLAFYAPPGDMKRSLHADGRQGGEKAPPWVDR